MDDTLYIVDNSTSMIIYKKYLDKFLDNVNNILYMDNEYEFPNYYKTIRNIDNITTIYLCISNLPTDDFGILDVNRFYNYIIKSKIKFNLVLFMNNMLVNFYYKLFSNSSIKLYNYREFINNKKIRYFMYAYMAFI